MPHKAIVTAEDFKVAFNLFCCVYGIGTLGMPGNFSRAGPLLAVVAMVFMAFANVYGAVAICRVMLMAPRSVKTYGDLGEWCMGTPGRYLSVISQMANCLLVPCVFLVLGGTLLDGLFPNAFSATTWIILMALSCAPVCLVPTLKEGAAAAFAGCMGTIIADVIGVGIVLHGMQGHPSIPKPDLNFKQVAGTFGNLALAYGAGIVIPSLQRQHSDPSRMPWVVGITMLFISVLFLILATSAYSAVGCQISGNLLYAIYPDETGLTTLGFASDWGMVVLAYLFMQLHITIAFSVILNPAFYIFERIVLGMHIPIASDVENNLLSYVEVSTPDVGERSEKHSPTSCVSKRRSILSVADNENIQFEDPAAKTSDYSGANVAKYIALRLAIITSLVVASVLLKDHFHDLADFTGASCITVNSIVLPIVFLLKKKWNVLPMWERIPALVVVIACFSLGCYVTYASGKNLFIPSHDDAAFPFCAPEFETTVYYNYTAAHEG
uniref:Amino acid transporter transmembrane domain-containing protein n=1 Tax=Peronospora matthiolae TaxID=2874970 RepID=A0AAV1U0T1_9STRA